MRRVEGIAAIAVVLVGLIPNHAVARDWDPIDPAILNLTTPRIDPDADAEALFWQVWLEDRLLGGRQPQSMQTHYLRIKLFTQKGVDEQTTIDVTEARSNVEVSEIQGRTIKPDGTIVELERAAVFERSVVQANGVDVSMRSFSMPNVEVGDIIEYQWVEYLDNQFVRHQRIDCQRDIPAWSIVYRVKPLARLQDFGYVMRTQDFGCRFGAFEEESYGLTRYSRMDVSDAQAFREEPSMPPESQVRNWALVHYVRNKFTDPTKYWPEYGKEVYEALKPELRIDKDIEEAAAQITAGASSDADKLERLVAFCRTEVRAVDGGWPEVLGEEGATRTDNKKPSDTLASGLGTARDVDLLFVALANAAGLDSRVVLVSRRNQRFFDVNFLNPYFLNSIVTGTNIDGEWVFHDFSSPYLESGMQRWHGEGVAALVAAPKAKDAEWLQTEISSPTRTTVRRDGTFDLLADGTLVGTVVHTYTGHMGVALKEEYDELSVQERENRVIETLTDRLPGAEVSGVGVTNADATSGAFSYIYSVRVTGYAAVTGRRMFVQPNFAKKNSAPRFSVNERLYEIYFNYPWREVDKYTINLPDGFSVEALETPRPIRAPGVGSYQAQLTNDGDSKIVYDRDFSWGEGGTVLFPKAAYPQIKGIFDTQNQYDQQVVTITQAAAE